MTIPHNPASKLIQLSQGKFAIVDASKYEFLMKWKWFYHIGYAVRNGSIKGGKPRKRIWMHREINQTPEGFETDHINRNTLDNRSKNLRNCTHSENNINKGLQRNSTTGFKGVCFHKREGKYVAHIKINGRKNHLGYFSTPDEASLEYQKASVKYHGHITQTA